jgi:CRP-like cAMP-binding protein
MFFLFFSFFSDVGVDDFLKTLSPVLSTEIKLSLYLKKITSTPFFQACGREVLIALSHCVNTRVYMAGDRIVRRGEHGSWMCFIAQGSVSVIVPCNNGDIDGLGQRRKEKEVAVLREGKGGYFGEMALLYDKPRNATIEARTWLRIHQLFRADFHRVFNLYPDEKIKMNSVIEKMKVFKKEHNQQIS